MTTVIDLGPARFAEFYTALHEDGGAPRRPFPWQQRLVDQVAASGQWPDLLDLPTASGKTTTVEIALYLLAAGVQVPRRIVFVVDRRIVVSQAARVARNAASKLTPQAPGILGEVARGLRALAPSPTGTDSAGTSVLNWAELRGGIARDEQWATRPDVPAVIVSTVDQVGSRLLFRGYGVSHRMAPVHAGLLGTDCLFLLDEVHLSAPFAQTLRAVKRSFRRPLPGQERTSHWKVVELSATPSEVGDVVRFRLGDADRDPGATPVLARRLAAQKPARLLKVPVTGTDEGEHRRRLAKTASAEAEQLVAAGVTTVGVIVNRVDTARAVRRLLAVNEDFDTCLLTGRMRALDRDDLLLEFGPRLAMGRIRKRGDRPLVMVATQAVEAGADFDLDVVVTECASLDALQQRFGRVRRDGIPDAPAGTSVILATSASVADGADDAVYGESLRETWRALSRAGTPLDLGGDGLARVRESVEPALVSTVAARSPVLFARHLDLWAQTSQRPDVDPDPALWLHGLEAPRPEVSVVWRGDLPDLREVDTARDGSDDLARELADLVGVIPPGAGESVSLPFATVAAWLEDLSSEPVEQRTKKEVPGPGAIADVDGSTEPFVEPTGGRHIAPVLRWNSDHGALALDRRDLQPGDVLVVPASYGGLAHGTFDPTARDAVQDRATEVAATQRRRPVLRLRPGLLPSALSGMAHFPAQDDEASTDDDVAAAREWLGRAEEALDGVDGDHAVLARRVVRSLSRDLRRTPTPRNIVSRQSPLPGIAGPDHLVLVGSTLLPRTGRDSDVDTVDEDTPESTGRAVHLEDHLAHVADWARQLAQNCGLPDELAHDVALAARLHDIGKVDPRFQQILADGELPEPTAKLLAKSDGAPGPARRRELRRQAGYPEGNRHEITSVSLMQANPAVIASANDPELVLHLVASHHGWARPFPPVVDDTATGTVDAVIGVDRYVGPMANQLHRLGSGVAERFWTLTRRYGWWGLAYLETVLRLADHRASAGEQMTSDGAGS